MNSALRRKTKSTLKLMLDLLDEKEADIKHDYGEKVEIVLFDMLQDLSFEIEGTENMIKERIGVQENLVIECIKASIAGKLWTDISDREFIDKIDEKLGSKEELSSGEYMKLKDIHSKIGADFFKKELKK